MSIITISRQYASGGSVIAALVGERLGWPVIDNDFIDRVAERADLSTEEVEEHEERVPSLVERLADALAISSPEVFVSTGEAPDARLGYDERMVKATQAVIDQLAATEPHVVMVGRGAQAALAGRPDAKDGVFAVVNELKMCARWQCKSRQGSASDRGQGRGHSR